ncbi:MAG: phosphomannomutase/phosphoglucomutase [Oscillospiraceae bacterium]|jgi:phosphomannomutase|nr:phosphomannomutase/phosphoglucomutase [Oscillospiraceae bacterium]
MIEKWKKLKSGSDIRGIAIGEESEIDLSSHIIRKIALAFASFLSRFKELSISNQTIAIGHDSRLSALKIKSILINSFTSVGINVCDCGLTSAPAISKSTWLLSCCASIEITASHHPKERNGLKFFTSEGGLSSTDIERILKIAQNRDFPSPSNIIGRVREVDLMTKYCEFIKNLITQDLGPSKPLKNLKIFVDASNGAGGFFTSKILEPLGADTYGSVLLNPDGNFSIHSPNPEDNEVIDYACKACVKAKSDLGIIFDADVDRVAIIDFNGKIINKEKLIALCAAVVLRKTPGAVIVTDSVTSDYLKEFIEKLGGIQFRYKRGYNNVINMAKELGSRGMLCPLAIETSGHAAFADNNFSDDGAYLAAKIIVEMVNLKNEGKNLSDLLKNLVCAAETKEIRIPISKKNPDIESIKIINKLRNFYKQIPDCDLEKDNSDGIRLNFYSPEQKGWCLLRKSAHDPCLVLNIESDINGGAEKILKSIWGII